MKTLSLATHISRSLLRCGFFILSIALCCFALSPPLEAGCPNPPGVCGGQNTAVGQMRSLTSPAESGTWALVFEALFNDTDWQPEHRNRLSKHCSTILTGIRARPLVPRRFLTTPLEMITWPSGLAHSSPISTATVTPVWDIGRLLSMIRQ